MAWSRGLGAVLLTVAGSVLLAPSPAWACDCGGGDADSFTRSADVVVVGIVTDREPPPPREVMSPGDPAMYTVAVSRVLEGEAAAAATEPAAANLSGDDPVAQSVVPWWAWAGGLGLLVGLGVVATVVVAGRRT